MGRKGVSKRKTRQTKTNSVTSNTGSGSVSSLMQATESQPVKSNESGNTVPSTKGGGRTSSDRKQKGRKG
jgi:hypothetical protein